MKNLLEAERDDWRNIRKGFEVSQEEGERRQAGKTDRCGLCPKYAEFKGEILFCRRCPFVLLFRRSCKHFRDLAGVKTGEKNIKNARMAEMFLEYMIERIESDE